MILSAKSEYACLALVDLAENYNRGLVKIGEISKRKRIPKKYLEQILLSLKKAGYLRSKRGADGGYQLSRPPNKITIAKIVRLMEGALAPGESKTECFYEHTSIERNRRLRMLLRDIRNYIANRLENTTFGDLVED